jgi:hypothetical protein
VLAKNKDTFCLLKRRASPALSISANTILAYSTFFGGFYYFYGVPCYLLV